MDLAPLMKTMLSSDSIAQMSEKTGASTNEVKSVLLSALPAMLSGVQGQASDIEIEAAHIMNVKKRLNQILAENTGRTAEEIERITDRNHWMFAAEAQEYGIIDHVI